MPDGPMILLILKVLVSAVTVLLVASLVALAVKRPRWHGRINIVFFILTMTTVLGFEVLLRLGTDVTSTFSDDARAALRIHLGFSIPAALVLPLMLLTGLRRRKRLHVGLGIVFLILWIGTFITGVFGLPHQ
jgi:hypothetical protein